MTNTSNLQEISFLLSYWGVVHYSCLWIGADGPARYISLRRDDERLKDTILCNTYTIRASRSHPVVDYTLLRIVLNQDPDLLDGGAPVLSLA